jgi:2-desacetyl-2-hydroxyethyl bacteriochlorophyllide A dehydrogenase
MKAAFFNIRGPHFDIREVETPTIVDDEVLLRVEACGICGTDLNMYRQKFETWKSWRTLVLSVALKAGLLRRFSDLNGLRLGHEIVGTVEKTNKPQLLNKKVIVFPHIFCDTCWSCQNGIETTCENLIDIGYNRAGGFAEFVLVPQKNIFEVSKSIDSSVATLAEPLACVLHAIDIAGVKENGKVLVIGAGTIGQLVTHICSTEYSSKTAVCDPSSFRLETARKLGATGTIKPDELESLDMLPDVVFECVGRRFQTLDTIIDVIQPRGTICIVGQPRGTQHIKLRRLQEKEVQIKTSQGCTFKNLQDALTRVENNAAKLRTLITHKFPLEKINEAFSVAIEHELNNAIKVTIAP